MIDSHQIAPTQFVTLTESVSPTAGSAIPTEILFRYASAGFNMPL
jgi:hypothetical protein